eukprot:jgi/Tetstr1/454160/TSEL_041079.t1
MNLTPLHTAYPTLSGKNVPVPSPDANGGWWHPDSAAPIGGAEVPRVDPTWSGQADNLIRGGAMQETSYHYPAGGVRPGNNEPAFLQRFVPMAGGTALAVPYQPPQPFSVRPHDTDPMNFNH